MKFAKNEQLLYRDFAKYYDRIYSEKDYEKETKELTDLIMRNKKSDGVELLEAGCGTGQYLKYFSKNFSCVGIDISSQMLDLARKKNIKNTKLFIGDITKPINIERKFDAIVCLYATISYVKTYANLRKTIANFSKSLKPGGVLIIETHYIGMEKGKGEKQMMKYEGMMPYMSVYDSPNLKIARVKVPKIVGDRMIMEKHILIGEKGREVLHAIDYQDVGLFDLDKVLNFMEEEGINSWFQKGILDRGICIGMKSADSAK